jgi:hypothetical protein
MGQVGNQNHSWFAVAIVGVAIGILAFITIPNYIRRPRTSPANACINNLREMNGAIEKWIMEHNAKTNDVVTLDDIKPCLVPYGEPKGFIKLDAKGNLPKCPAGGIYRIGKIGESPACSLGTTVSPFDVLQ